MHVKSHVRVLITAGVLCLPAPTMFAEGHGPAFGLAPPTLGDGAWSSDTMVMSLGTEDRTIFMFREMVGYGINEDLQATLSFPLSRPINRGGRGTQNHRAGAMSGSFTDLEGTLLWRFHRQGTDVGARFESTLLFGGSLPIEERRAGVKIAPSGHFAAVSGYASRTLYAWLGGGYQHYLEDNDDRLGPLPYASAVFGWRPPMFRHDFPKPDWRLFVEGLAEFPQRDRINGRKNPNSGGEKLLLGPSVLGLYGKWGVEGGVLFPVHQDLNGEQAEERFRAKLVFTWWF